MPKTSTLRLSGAKLRKLRLSRGWLQSDLAEHCAAAGRPVRRDWISRIESNGGTPSAPVLRVLLDVFEVEIDAVLEDEPTA